MYRLFDGIFCSRGLVVVGDVIYMEWMRLLMFYFCICKFCVVNYWGVFDVYFGICYIFVDDRYCNKIWNNFCMFDFDILCDVEIL